MTICVKRTIKTNNHSWHILLPGQSLQTQKNVANERSPEPQVWHLGSHYSQLTYFFPFSETESRYVALVGLELYVLQDDLKITEISSLGEEGDSPGPHLLLTATGTSQGKAFRTAHVALSPPGG